MNNKDRKNRARDLPEDTPATAEVWNEVEALFREVLRLESKYQQSRQERNQKIIKVKEHYEYELEKIRNTQIKRYEDLRNYLRSQFKEGMVIKHLSFGWIKLKDGELHLGADYEKFQFLDNQP